VTETVERKRGGRKGRQGKSIKEEERRGEGSKGQ